MTTQAGGSGGRFWKGVFQNAVGSWLAAIAGALLTPPIVIFVNEIWFQLTLLRLDQGAIAA